MDTWPLEGIRVLDLTRNVAGPYGTMILADLGADVVKVEHPVTGDDTRQWGPPFWQGESAMYLALNRNKRSLALDLHDRRAGERLAPLVREADVLIQSFRPGYLDRLGLGIDWARALNPDLVYCSISGFGETGPMAHRPAYDPLMQAFSGLMSVTGEPEGGPVRVGVALNDLGTGIWSALGILAALTERSRTGKASHVRVSLYETALSLMSYHLTGIWGGGGQPARMGASTGMIVPYEAFATRQGHVVICAGNNKLFAALCEALGRPGLALDRRFADNPARVQHRDALHAELQAVTERLSVADLMARLEGAGVPASPLRTLPEVAEDAQAQALGMFQETMHPVLGNLRAVALPLTLDGERPPLRLPPPDIGQHNADFGAAPRDPD